MTRRFWSIGAFLLTTMVCGTAMVALAQVCEVGGATSKASGSCASPCPPTNCGQHGEASACAMDTHVRVGPAADVAARTGASPRDMGLVDLTTVLEPVRAYYRVPGMAVGLVRNGKLSAIGAVGTRMVGSNRAVELTDKWHIGSCGKAFTATAAVDRVMRLPADAATP